LQNETQSRNLLTVKTSLILSRRLLSRAAAALLAVSIAAGALSGCSSGGSQSAGAGDGGRPVVVAAENFWGSIAAQIGGGRVTTVSIITKPDTDPHAYEPVPNDARTVAQARYVIQNGAGYDPWVSKLLAANPSSGRRELDIASLAGRREGDNPHMWYSPEIVGRVADRITSDLARIDAKDSAYFTANASAFKVTALQRYNAVRDDIRAKYTGVPVGATESVFVDLAHDLGLQLLTPAGYMKAISEGTDPVASDKATFDGHISSRAIKVLVFNNQNSTPDVQALVDKARGLGIPVVPITETLAPAGATFQDWQTAQLTALQAALAQPSRT
jgi:zinc/manganese transport system substrate-binding protein